MEELPQSHSAGVIKFRPCISPVQGLFFNCLRVYHLRERPRFRVGEAGTGSREPVEASLSANESLPGSGEKDSGGAVYCEKQLRSRPHWCCENPGLATSLGAE